jgi:plasmid stabilization system protein ParE
MRLRFSAGAEADLREILAFIADDNPRRARTFLRELRRACHSLLDKPNRFPLISRAAAAGVRKRPYGAYVILYQVGENAVLIVRVLHSARDYYKVLDLED